MAEFKCNTCKFYKVGSRCECCFENEHYEADKYRWHDLRKNPNDLPPKDFLTAFVAVDFFGTELYTVCSFDGELFHDGINPPTIFNKDIVAWREIEPFKVGV